MYVRVCVSVYMSGSVHDLVVPSPAVSPPFLCMCVCVCVCVVCAYVVSVRMWSLCVCMRANIACACFMCMWRACVVWHACVVCKQGEREATT